MRRAEEYDPEDNSASDEIKLKDGAFRYWLFLNGEEFCLFAGLGAAFCAVLWCFLYFFGAGRSVPGIVLLAVGTACFLGWWFVGREVRELRDRGWTKGEKARGSSERDKGLLPVAIGLWLFIFLCICVIIISKWWHPH